jgi:thioesterase domain-containing protein
MAADYIAQIRQVQESGPYHLLGWSLGGIVAHEIAVQLQASGDEVAALVSLDAYPPAKEESIALGDNERESAKAAETGADLGIPEDAEAARQEHPMRREGRLRSVISDKEFAALAQIRENNERIARAHEPRRFEGDLLIIVAIDGRLESADSAARWNPYVSGKISKSYLPCSHGEMNRPAMLARAWLGIASWLGLRS